MRAFWQLTNDVNLLSRGNIFSMYRNIYSETVWLFPGLHVDRKALL